MRQWPVMASRPGGRGRERRFGTAAGRGRSGLRRAGCWLTASRGDPQESATENKPPMAPSRRGLEQVRVKRCGKSAPAPGVTRAARQTPPGARSSVGRLARPMSPGRPLRWMTTHPVPAQGRGQNPAYRPAHHHHLRRRIKWPLTCGFVLAVDPESDRNTPLLSSELRTV